MAEEKPDAQPAADVPAAAASAIDWSVPGPPLTCESFTYAPGGDAAAKEFLCPVSHQPLFGAVQCVNGHCCCRGCFEKAGSVCPLCRDASGEHVAVAVNVKNVLDGLHVVCPDCHEEMARERLLHHRNNQCLLPCIRDCGTTVTRTGAAQHDLACRLVPVKCEADEFGCPWEGPRGEQAVHAAACDLRGMLPALRLMSERIAQLQALQRDYTAQGKRIAAQEGRIAALEACLAEHIRPSKWHKLGDAFCEANGVKLGNGWESLNLNAFRFAKDAHGFVHLDGMIKGGKADHGTAMLTLPVGYRPALVQPLPIDGGCGFGEVLIDSSGKTYVRAKGAVNDWFSLAGITFSTV